MYPVLRISSNLIALLCVNIYLFLLSIEILIFFHIISVMYTIKLSSIWILRIFVTIERYGIFHILIFKELLVVGPPGNQARVERM